jgi:hypothetical protein
MKQRYPSPFQSPQAASDLSVAEHFANESHSRLLNDSEAAVLLRVSSATLRSWRCRGIGPDYHKFGPGTRSAVRYDVKDIRAYMAGCRRVPSVRAALGA